MNRETPPSESRERDELISRARARASELEELIAWGEELIGRCRELEAELAARLQQEIDSDHPEPR